jgi:hypothetical protein
LTAADVVFDVTDDVDAKLTLQTPVSEDIIVAFSNEGSLKDFKTCLKITYSGFLQHDASFKFDFTGAVKAFTTKGSLTYNDKLVSADVSFDATKDIEVKITLKTPISKDNIIAFSNEGHYTNFKTCLKITYSGSLQHDAILCNVSFASTSSVTSKTTSAAVNLLL